MKIYCTYNLYQSSMPSHITNLQILANKLFNKHPPQVENHTQVKKDCVENIQKNFSQCAEH